MPFDWNQFVAANSSAIFGLAGALAGGILSFIGAFLMKRREFNLMMFGKLLDRRISAHEKVIFLATEMRVMTALGGVSPSGEVRRTPQIMLSQEHFEDWFSRYTQACLDGTTWHSTETKREANFVQDYVVTLHTYLHNVPSESYAALGEIIRQDFVDLSSSLEKAAYSFFERGIRKLRLDSLSQWHKYKFPETERRMRETSLLKNSSKFVAATRSDERQP